MVRKYPDNGTEIISFKETGITQLTAPGSTGTLNVENYSVFGYALTVASIDTSVDIALKGSVDGTNTGTLTLANTGVDGGSITNNKMTITEDGTYFVYSKDPVVTVCLDFVDETGGTGAAIDADFFARRL